MDNAANNRLARRIIFLTALLVGLLFAVLRINSIPIGAFFYDDAQYIVLAESIAAGQGYQYVSFPQAAPNPAFPPGWPLLLSPLVKLFPANLTILKTLPFLFWIAAILLTYILFSRRLDWPYLGLFIAAVALNPHLIALSGTIMSEAAYLFFSLAALTLFERWNRSEHRYNRWLLAGVFVLAAMTALIRTIGLSLVLAIVVCLIVQRRGKDLWLLAGVAGLIILAGAIFYAAVGNAVIISVDYTNHFQYVAAQLKEYAQIWRYFPKLLDGTISNALFPVFDLGTLAKIFPSSLQTLFSAALAMLLLTGWIISLRQYQAGDIYFAVYTVVFYLWTVYVGFVQLRLLLPLVPFLLFYLLQAIRWLAEAIFKSRRWAWRVSAATFAVIALLALGRNIYEWQNPIAARRLDLSIGASWIRENAPIDSVVMTADPIPDYLYARRKTVFYPTDALSIESFVEAGQIDFVLIKPQIEPIQTWQVSQRAQDNVLPFIVANPTQFETAYRNEAANVTVYRVLSANK